MSFLNDYENATRIEGVLMAVLLLLSLAAPVRDARSSTHRIVTLIVVVTWVSLVVPVATHGGTPGPRFRCWGRWSRRPRSGAGGLL